MLGFALVSACASVARLEAPVVTVTQVRVDRLTAMDARFTVEVGLVNPNDRAVAVDGIDARLTIEGIDVGTARLAAPVVLPAHGQSSASIAAHADLAASLRATAQVAERLADRGQTPPGVRYSLAGTAVVDGGTLVPFSRSGEFKLRMAGEK